MLCLNENHIEEGIDHKNLREIIIKYHSHHRKHAYGIVIERNKYSSSIF